MISRDTEKKLKQIFTEVIDDRVRLDIETHDLHHRFISDEIEHRRIKRVRCEKIRQQVFGWGIIVTLGATGTFIAKKFGF